MPVAPCNDVISVLKTDQAGFKGRLLEPRKPREHTPVVFHQFAAIEIEDVEVRVSELERSAELPKGAGNRATRPTVGTVGSANAETEAADNSGVGG